MKSRIGFILLVSSVLLPRFGFSEGSGKGLDMKASYKPKPGEKWAVIEIRDIKKKMKYEAVPEVLAKDRRADRAADHDGQDGELHPRGGDLGYRSSDARPQVM